MAPSAGEDVTIRVEHGERTLDSPAEETTAARALAPGQMLGRYALLTRVGHGGMGAVFTAHDPDLDRTVAIKLLHTGIDDQRLEREARGLAKVSHPNVIAVYDVGRATGRVFLAMEFVQGLTLRKWLQDTARSREAILNVFMQAGRGLEAAHAAGLVHRDFKPDNVLVGDDGRVRVLDFGLVDGVAAPEPSVSTAAASPTYDYDSSSGGGRLTANGAVLGTPAYMALEQYAGTADPRTDQYSYCVALWEALYGKRPFEYSSVVELLARLRSGPPPEAPPDSDVPAWLERLLRRGLSRHPDARFASMSELLDLLQASLLRTRAREALIGFRYRPLETHSSEGFAAIDTFTDQRVLLRRCQEPHDFEELGSCEHPNIVPVLDVARSHAGVHYLVLDVAQAQKTLIEAAESAPLAIQLEWFCELIRAFHYLHQRRIGHAACELSDVLVVGGHVRLLVTRVEAFEGEPSVRRDLSLLSLLITRLSSPAPALLAFANKLRADGGHAPAHAASALEALERATERALAIETAETRESFLRAVPLLGRETTSKELQTALAELDHGRGSAFFVEGESGVGKSRLLEDLRRKAVASGVFVLEGRGEASTRSPFRVFRLPLLRLSLRAGSEAFDDFQLETLTPLLPELPTRLGRTAKSVTDAEPSRDAFRNVVLGLLRQEKAPLLLLLEDLQWAGSESLALLGELVLLSEQQPLLIVASCRSQEASVRANLPAAMHTLSLSRLESADIGNACRALIGEGYPPELVSLLERETEGNAFFLIEALRALAEDAKSLSALKSTALPNRIFAGGIQTLIRRHLDAVSERGRPLLRLAAVLGRGMDEDVLRALSPELDVDAWVSECVAAAVLERVEAGRDVGIRFRHDKLREALLDELEPDERRAAHARVAAVLERTRGHDPEQLAALARHFQAAGDTEKELLFAARAGEQALRSRAFAEAEQLLTRSTELAVQIPHKELLPKLSALRAELHVQRSEWSQADVAICAAFAAAGRPLWEKKLGDAFFLFVQLLIHLVRSLLPTQQDSEPPKNDDTRADLVRAADVQLNGALTLGKNSLALASSLLAVNLSQPGRPTSVRALLLLALAARVARLRGVTRRYIARANALLPLTTDRKDLAEALSYFGFYWVGEGKLRRAREYLLRSVEASSSINYQLPLSWSVGQLSMCASLQGRFVEMLQQAEACERYATTGDATFIAAKCTQSLALLRLRRLEEAKRCNESLGDPSPADSPLSLAIRAATNASIELEEGRLTQALAAADNAHRALPWASQVPPVWPDVLTAPIEVYLAAWEKARASDEPQLARAAGTARRRIRALRGWARIYPVAQPLADYYSAREAWLSERDEEATQLFERARNGAHSRGLGHYERLGAEAVEARRRSLQTSAM